MTNINKLPQLSDNLDYLIVYEYSHPILDITRELIINNIEFSHHICQLSDNSYLLININQFTNVN